MRHRNSGRKLSRTPEHRKALFKNMARSILTYERIRTTEAKAKELRIVVDKLITLALRNDLHSRRQAFKILENHLLVKRLFDEIGPRYTGGQGGYTRITKLGLPRVGDNAPLVFIELTHMAGAPAPQAKEPKASPDKAAKVAAAAAAMTGAAQAPEQAATPADVEVQAAEEASADTGQDEAEQGPKE